MVSFGRDIVIVIISVTHYVNKFGFGGGFIAIANGGRCTHNWQWWFLLVSDNRLPEQKQPVDYIPP